MRVPATASWCLLLLTAPDSKNDLSFLAKIHRASLPLRQPRISVTFMRRAISDPHGIALVLRGIAQHRHAPRGIRRVIIVPATRTSVTSGRESTDFSSEETDPAPPPDRKRLPAAAGGVLGHELVSTWTFFPLAPGFAAGLAAPGSPRPRPGPSAYRRRRGRLPAHTRSATREHQCRHYRRAFNWPTRCAESGMVAVGDFTNVRSWNPTRATRRWNRDRSSSLP